jgi:hypothetical protein
MNALDISRASKRGIFRLTLTICLMSGMIHEMKKWR